MNMSNIDTPINFKVIGYGNDVSSIALDSMSRLDLNGISIIDANECHDIQPSNDDKMAIFLVTGDDERAANCARTFYQAGVLTLVITCSDACMPVDCCDTQALVSEEELISYTTTLLDIVFNTNSYICLDFCDLYSTLHDSRRFLITSTQSMGESRVANALSDIRNRLSASAIDAAENIIISLYFNSCSNRPIAVNEVKCISDFISIVSQDTNAIFGISHDGSLAGDNIRMAFIVSGKEI